MNFLESADNGGIWNQGNLLDLATMINPLRQERWVMDVPPVLSLE